MKQMEDIMWEICDKYCKYMDQYRDAEDEDALYEICDHCPLNKIL